MCSGICWSCSLGCSWLKSPAVANHCGTKEGRREGTSWPPVDVQHLYAVSVPETLCKLLISVVNLVNLSALPPVSVPI